MNFFKNIIDRLSEPSPEFFKVFQKIGLTIAALSACVIGMRTIGVPIPEIISSTLNYCTLSSGAVLAFFTALTSIWRNPDGTINKAAKQKYLDEKERSA